MACLDKRFPPAFAQLKALQTQPDATTSVSSRAVALSLGPRWGADQVGGLIVGEVTLVPQRLRSELDLVAFQVRAGSRNEPGPISPGQDHPNVSTGEGLLYFFGPLILPVVSSSPLLPKYL
jgi:hypothetical protein